MKRFLIVSLVMFMVLSLSSKALAAIVIWADMYEMPYGGDGIPDYYCLMGPGDTVYLDIYASNLTEIPDLRCFGFNMYFDPTQLALVPCASSVNFIDWPMASKDEHDDHIYMTGCRLTGGIMPDPSLLATIVLVCVGPGSNYLTFTKPEPPLTGFELFDGTVVDDIVFPTIWVFSGVDDCEGDFDDDGDVDGGDLAIFAFDFGRTDCIGGIPPCPCDVDHDCDVDDVDLMMCSYPICDFDGDGDFDGADMAVCFADFGRDDCCGDCPGDFDGDGDVDGSDLAIFAADFGRTDCPYGQAGESDKQH